MKNVELPVISLFEKFIRDTEKGKRLQPDGTRVKKQSINNYRYILRYLREFQENCNSIIRIKPVTGNNAKAFIHERNYWKKFYIGFTEYLYTKKSCFDNYVGQVMKIMRTFFNYLRKEKGVKTGEFYEEFYRCKEDIPVLTLLPAQLKFLATDKNFELRLTKSLRKSKDILVFGCTVGLRVSDLFNIQFKDILVYEGVYYLPVKTIKTGTEVRLKLPKFAVEIAERFAAGAKRRKTIFPPIPLARFNSHLKTIAELAGWTHVIGKFRRKRGQAIEEMMPTTNKEYRFCDLISSHIMRRTAITTMLMMGMKEHIVRLVSGHTQNSHSFYRYVHLAQSYMDNEMDRVFDKLFEG